MPAVALLDPDDGNSAEFEEGYIPAEAFLFFVRAFCAKKRG